MKKLFFILLGCAAIGKVAAQSFTVDYSFCGYLQSEQPLPAAKVAVVVTPGEGDQSQRIQRAINYVSSLKVDKKTGLRGAVLLQAGTYELSAPLRISTSGVVLRGTDKKQTVLLKKGVDRGAAVYIEGTEGLTYADTMAITSQQVIAGARTLTVDGRVRVGDEVVVWHPSTQEWINHLGCSTFGGGKDLGYWGWHPGEIDVKFTRRVKAVEGAAVTLDAPIPMTLDRQWATAQLVRVKNDGRIMQSGVENLTICSDYDRNKPKDEDHCWTGVYIDRATDCWVRMVDFYYLAGSAVIVQRYGQQITVEDCASREPISEMGGYRRRTFYVLGEKCLFQRCYSEQGIHDFSAGFCAAGPNAFVQCDSKESFGFSGSIGPWATGLLFDDVNIDGHDLRLMNLGIEKYGTGWNAANSLLYQSTAAGIFAYDPDSLQRNTVYGCWAQFEGNSLITESNNHVKPWSIFAQQLADRLGRDVSMQCRTLERNTEASSSPTIDEAMVFSREAHQPRVTIEMWIDSAVLAVPTMVKGVKTVDQLPQPPFRTDVSRHRPNYGITDGKLTMDNRLLVGGKHSSPWWNGRVREPAIAKATYALTRHIPGHEGRGATDRIDSVVVEMERTHTLMFSQNYGLWYDRRRDDHERVRRRDGDVWAPFYEQPHARSGEGTAWDGLSKYDLNMLNKWYYARLNEFAEKAAPKGLLLFNEHYFQHNILEAGAHWVDCPWRSANNINNSGFPEPVPFTGDKRIFMADYFYDIDDPVRRELHHRYIWQSLDALKEHPNVIHSIGEEFTGPLHFVQFWLDVVAEWEAANGQQALVALAVNKDVQDSILRDSVRSKVVDIIDIEQWFYHNKGEYAPPGGVNMAPRQYLRKIKAGSPRFEDAFRAVKEYREAYPDKAVVYYAQKYPELCWAVLMAGGSCPAIPVSDAVFLNDVARMQPSGDMAGVCTMQDDATGALIYCDADNKEAMLTLPGGVYDIYQIDPLNGNVTLISANQSLPGSYLATGKGITWLKRKK